MTLSTYKKTLPTTRLNISATVLTIKLAEIYELGRTVFDGDSGSFSKWLGSDVVSLNNHKPIELLDSLTGVSMVKDLLLQMEYGVV
jgi:putative toxin-antitoxin system antitoxin component (TIGR02293 family)